MTVMRNGIGTDIGTVMVTSNVSNGNVNGNGHDNDSQKITISPFSKTATVTVTDNHSIIYVYSSSIRNIITILGRKKEGTLRGTIHSDHDR